MYKDVLERLNASVAFKSLDRDVRDTVRAPPLIATLPAHRFSGAARRDGCKEAHPAVYEDGRRRIVWRTAKRSRLRALAFPTFSEAEPHPPRDVPPPIAPPGDTSLASRCAGDQDRYWPYHDVLFAHLGNQTHDNLLRYASDLKLDTAAFTQCLDSGKFRVAVERDKELGIRGGVTATPAFFVNGSTFR